MKQKIANILNCIVFLVLILFVVIHATYLFRGAEKFGRKIITGIKNEPADSIDVAFIGPSSVYRYWDTMKAYSDYGFTSYNYSTSAMTAAGTISAIKDIEKTQNPKLIIFEPRKLLSGHETTEFGRDTRNVFDAQDISIDRFKAIRYFQKLYSVTTKDAIGEYIGIIQYHDNFEALKNPENWVLIDNRLNPGYEDENSFKGTILAARHTAVEAPSDEVFIGSEKSISAEAEKTLTDIIEYCKSSGIELMLVVSPYSINEDNEAEINYITKVCDKYGIIVLDTNKLYSEIGIDFASDFDDTEHVNGFGEDKFTAYLGNYLKEHYDLPDNKRADWDKLYIRYKDKKDAIDVETAKLMEENSRETLTN